MRAPPAGTNAVIGIASAVTMSHCWISGNLRVGLVSLL
jgi:hypothetical protein